MKNKKGFTLIELLAVIVILAIIMVVAIPQILNVINNSRKSSWDSNVKLVAKSIDLNNTMDQTGVIGNGQTTSTGQTKGYPLSSLCSNGALTNFDKITEVGDINFSASSCSKSGNTYTFTLKGQNQFKNYEATIECTTSKACKILSKTYGTASSSGSNSGSGSSTASGQYYATGYGYIGYRSTNEYPDYKALAINDTENKMCFYGKCYAITDYDVDDSTQKVIQNGENTQYMLNDIGGYYCADSESDTCSFEFSEKGNGYECIMSYNSFYCESKEHGETCYLYRNGSYSCTGNYEYVEQ